MSARGWAITTFGTTCAVFFGACSDTSGPSRLGSNPPPQPLNCSIPVGAIADGGPGKDGIPALVNPSLVINGDSDIGYLQDSDRVIGVAWSGEAVAVPLNVGWWHEIVNLEIDGLPVAITHCPLTGSSLAFDRDPADGATFGVSGLLYQNNLIMYDRNDAESLWPQMSRGARCGTRDGTALRMLPVIEMTWEGWRTLHPNTKVVAGVSGRGYHRNTYPYSNGTYDQVGNNVLLFDMPGGVDTRRPIKERVLGVPDGSGGMAFPFGALDAVGPAAAVRGTLADGSRYVVFASKLGGAELELTGRFNVTGRNLPSGSAVNAGVVVPWIL